MTQATQIAADDALSPLRALNSLTSAQASQIVAGFSNFAAIWTITRHEGCDGQLSLLIAHTGYDTTLIVDRDQDGIHVSLMLGDQVHVSQHRYRTIRDAVTAIKAMAAVPTLQTKRYTA